jgi:hypothetical protein
MLGSRAVAIELGRKRLCALQAGFRRSGVVVRRMLVEPIPADLSRADPEALGRWLAETLRKAGMPTTRAAIALSRDEVILKRLVLPTTVDAELPDMTRLAVSRDLPFDAEQAVIDFVPLEKSETSTTVLALAMPRSELEAAQRVYKAAGIDAARVSLRAMGAAALLASVPGLKREPTLIIDITGERIEFGVVVGGSIRFSRAADLPNGGSSESLTETIITETRRTWMSYRIGDDTEGVRQVIMIGDESAAELAADSIAGILNITPIVLHTHPQIERGHLRLGVAWPLAGLLLEQRHQEHVIDMAHPRKPPDVHARLRLRVLAGAAVLIAVCGVAFTFLRADLRRLETQESLLKEQYEPVVPEYLRIKRDVLKLEHLEQWQDVRIDWLDHIEHLGTLVPGRGQLVLNDLTGALQFDGVRYDSPKRGDAKQWLAPSSAQISVQGEAKDRELADKFRGAIVDDSRYKVSSSGPEREGGQRLECPFNYKLIVLGGDDGGQRGEAAP